MTNIFLICSAGMSTSLLVQKMEAAAKEQNIDVNIEAYAEAEASKHIDQANIILLGPQVRFLKDKIAGKIGDRNIKLDIINTTDYGMMNGAKVLEAALKLLDS